MVAEYVGRVYDTMLLENLNRGISNTDPYIKEYQSVDIDQDSNTDIYYSTLPEKIILLSRAGSGVIRITGMKSSTIEFTPMSNNQLINIPGLDVDDIDDVVGYVYKNGRVEYYGMTVAIAAGTVRMELVIPFESYGEDDDVPLPVGGDEILVQRVVQMVMGIPDSDRKNNSNSLNTNLTR
jgi:hypothetical protein